MNLYVGIDVSKEHLDICFDPARPAVRRPNTPSAAESLALELQKATLVVLEATGGYEQTIAAALFKKNIPVSIVNPKRVRDYARSRGQLAKTDQLDAKLLAEYAKVIQPKLTEQPSLIVSRLKELCAYRDDLLKSRTAYRNRLKKVSEPFIQKSIRALLEMLNVQIAEAENEMNKCIESNGELKDKAKILLEVKGVGPALTRVLLGRLPELGKMSAKKIAALVGVAPFNCDSGYLRGKRKIWGGRRTIRPVLYMAANIARRFDPMMGTFYQRLIDNGKPFKVALTACMRKLLVILNAKLRDHMATATI